MSQSSLLHNVHVTTQYTTCPAKDCGVLVILPADTMQKLRNSHAWFYCHRGHQMSFTGKTEAEELRETLETVRGALTRARVQADRAEAKAQRAERSKAATRGVLTKTKKRIAAGVCPCCRRSFTNVARHMAGQHPEYAAEPVP